MQQTPTAIKSFVRRQGNITSGQENALKELGQYFIIPFQTERLCYTDYLPGAEKVTLEIGFGMGDATAAIAKANPKQLYLGVEVYESGIGKLLMHIKAQNLANVRIINHDAVEVLSAMIEQASLDAVHLFFPDPWPKKRHHKRRLLQAPFVSQLAKALKPAGYLYVVTDWQDYAEQILAVLQNEPLLINKYEGYADAQSWRPLTKFQQKGLSKNHTIFECYFTKKL